MADNPEPSKEELEAAVDLLWPLYHDDRLSKLAYAKGDAECQRVAVALRAFAAAAVTRERERWKETVLKWHGSASSVFKAIRSGAKP